MPEISRRPCGVSSYKFLSRLRGVRLKMMPELGDWASMEGGRVSKDGLFPASLRCRGVLLESSLRVL